MCVWVFMRAFRTIGYGQARKREWEGARCDLELVTARGASTTHQATFTSFLFVFFCRCHVLFLATVTANGTRPHKGTDCEANSGLDMHVYELQLLLQEFVAPHEHILKY